ncbi:MAG TPA: cob(I)yrinic acid a,c-diamide adenosyltransferase, partial [Cytophagaceae bacterium]|nr:cob(I)yrinic acid a,c-diamide adenosyltransferase [Cytophagaceae bacterium]
TKTGDKGSTSLLGGTRVKKSDARIESYGTVDELNSLVGLVRDCTTHMLIREELLHIQNILFVIGSHLACEKENLKTNLPYFKEEDIYLLEKSIDRMNEELEPMKHFILPGGHLTVSHCHVARSVCRRAERNIVALYADLPQDVQILSYINRLADYLFVLARYFGKLLGVDEIPWVSKNK